VTTLVLQQRRTAIEQVVDRIEDRLFEKRQAWVKPTVERLGDLLAAPSRGFRIGVRSDLQDWLGLAAKNNEEQLSHRVTRYQGAEWSADRRAFCIHLLNKLQGKVTDLSEKLLTSLVVGGLQYVVLHYNANLREFRGAYLRSNVLSTGKLDAVKSSLRVPHRRGAVSWMSSLLSEGAEVVTLHDAGLDLRGRVAAEDLVFGNHSVCGFPLRDEVARSLGGFFFVSHPVQGLFTEPGVSGIMVEIRHAFERELARAVEADLIVEFGAETLQRSEEWNDQAYLKSLGTAPIMSLADTSPTGFLAGLRITRARNAVEREAEESVLDCHISEMPFINAVWWHLQLTSTFHEQWSDQLPRHLHEFSKLLDLRLVKVNASIPRLAWIPQYRLVRPGSDTDPGVDLTHRYYPPELVEQLDKWTADKGVSWLAWHVRVMRMFAEDADRPQTRFHHRIDAALAVYAGPNHADLVIPIFGGHDGSAERVVGFFRINCDPAPVVRPAAFVKASDPFIGFRQLYALVQASVRDLDLGFGRLLSWTDDALHHVPSEVQSIRLFKQLVDAARSVSDWAVLYLADALTGKTHNDRASFEIVDLIYSHLSTSLNSDLKSALGDTLAAFQKLGDGLQNLSAQNRLPDIPVITLWLQSSRPVVDIVQPTDIKQTNQMLEDLSQLLERDPGLPQLLSYLSFAFSNDGAGMKLEEALDLRKRLRICQVLGETSPRVMSDEEGSPLGAEIVLDLGVPPSDDDITALAVTKIHNEEGATWLDLMWRIKDSKDKYCTLQWNWRRVDHHPFPAAVQPIPWKVSRRVGAVISQNARVILSEELTGKRAGEMISIESAFVHPPEILKENLHLLETSLGVAEAQGKACWKVVAIAEQEYLLMLVGGEPATSVVTAFQNVALAYERGAHLAWIRGEEHYERETLAEQLAAVNHGYTGPVGSLRHELTMTKARWGAERALSPEAVLDAMRAFIEQASAIIRLGEAAIDFAKMTEHQQPQWISVTGVDLSEYIAQVVRAYQPLDGRSISLEQADHWRLLRNTVKIDYHLFIHGFSKLVDNAVKVARQHESDQSVSETMQPGVLITLDIATDSLLLTISNISAPLEEGHLDRIRRGLLSGLTEGSRDRRGRGGLGLREAWKCFQRLGIAVDVQLAEPPFRVAVKLSIPTL